MKFKILIAMLAVFSLIAAACGDDDESSSSGGDFGGAVSNELAVPAWEWPLVSSSHG